MLYPFTKEKTGVLKAILPCKATHPDLIIYTAPYTCTFGFFLVVFCMSGRASVSRITGYLSSVSMEMFICQGTTLAVALYLSSLLCGALCVMAALACDILLAIMVHEISMYVSKKIRI